MAKNKFNIHDLNEYYICQKYFSFNKKRKISEFNVINNIIGQLYLYKNNKNQLAPISIYTNIFQQYITLLNDIDAERVAGLNHLLLNYYNTIYTVPQNILLVNKLIYFRNPLFDVTCYIPILFERNKQYFIHWCITNEQLFNQKFNIKHDLIINASAHILLYNIKKKLQIKNEVYNLLTGDVDYIHIDQRCNEEVLDFIQYLSYGIIKQVHQPHNNSYCKQCEFSNKCVFGSK